jgi:hypothetical protein
MSIMTDLARPHGPSRGIARSGSIREVSLVGRPPGFWTSGQRVDWAGRAYRIVGDAGRYVHLRPETGEACASG